MGWYCCFIIHSFPFFLLSLLPTFSSRDSSQHQPRIQQTPASSKHTPSRDRHNSTTPSRDDTTTSHEYNRHLPAGDTNSSASRTASHEHNRHLPAGDTTAPPPSRDDTSSRHTQQQQTHTKQPRIHPAAQHPPTPPHQAPHKYPFICRITAYYPLSSLIPTHT